MPDFNFLFKEKFTDIFTIFMTWLVWSQLILPSHISFQNSTLCTSIYLYGTIIARIEENNSFNNLHGQVLKRLANSRIFGSTSNIIFNISLRQKQEWDTSSCGFFLTACSSIPPSSSTSSSRRTTRIELLLLVPWRKMKK